MRSRADIWNDIAGEELEIIEAAKQLQDMRIPFGMQLVLIGSKRWRRLVNLKQLQTSSKRLQALYKERDKRIAFDDAVNHVVDVKMCDHELACHTKKVK